MGKTGDTISMILVAVIGLAIIAVLVSKNAQTSTVISGATTGFSSILQAAVAPVTGSTNGIGLSNSSGMTLPTLST